MKKIEFNKRKSLKIRYSGRSSDYITPSFGWGCLFKCTYCYMRRHKPDGLSIATNVDDILQAIQDHSDTLGIKESNQTHSQYWTNDIGCNEDFALHSKFHDWRKIFDFFKNSDNLFATFATKYVNKDLLNYNPNKRIRIRFTLMPQFLSDILEPGTSKIIDRIKAVNDFYRAGYEVHLNFSPIICNEGYSLEYIKLFKLIDKYVDDDIKNDIKCECIFLTHNEKMHEYNLKNSCQDSEDILWKPDVQESKVSSYGSVNLRYKWQLKKTYEKYFKYLLNKHLKWCKIRYIF